MSNLLDRSEPSPLASARSFAEMISLQVLLIDESGPADEIEAVLERAGYSVHLQQTSSAHHLRSQLARDQWDILLFDPADSSWSLSEIIEVVEESEHDVPIIIVSNNIAEDQATEAMQLGVRDYVLKSHLARLGPIVARESRDQLLNSERRQIEESLRESNAILQATQEASGEGICLVSKEGKVVSTNTFFTLLWNLKPAQARSLMGEEQLLYHILSQLQDPDEWVEKINYLFDYPFASTRDEVPLKDGRTLECHSSPATSVEGENYGRVWSFKDITPHKNHQVRLAHQAFHDPVTGLPTAHFSSSA